MILTARRLTKKTWHPILNLFAQYKFLFAKKKKKEKKRKEKKTLYVGLVLMIFTGASPH